MKKDISFLNIYNKIAADYDRKYSESCAYASDFVLELLTKQISKPGKLVDIGCGTGLLLSRILSKNLAAETYGVDPAIEMLSVAKKRLPNTQFFQAKAEELPFDDGSIDTVVSTVSFSHWHDKKLALQEIARILVPGGSALIIEHDMPSFFQLAILKLIRRLPEFIDLLSAKELLYQVPALTPYILDVVNNYLVIYVKKGSAGDAQ